MARFAYTTQPVRTAAYTGTIDTSGNASTDWTDLVSSDVTDSKTGSALGAGLIFTSVAVQNRSSSASAFLKLRARVGAGDATSGEFEIPAGSAISIECASTKSGSGLAAESPTSTASQSVPARQA